MPFKSESHRRLMWACHPVIARAWAHGEEAPRDYRKREAALKRAGRIPKWCALRGLDGPPERATVKRLAAERATVKRKTKRRRVGSARRRGRR